MIRPGTYPAAVTPLDDKGRVDMAGVAKLLAWIEAAGCTGAVLAGTNGEGPSLSAVEKRDLIAEAMPLKGKLDLILGIATPSLEEAVWLTKRAADAGAIGALVMPPFYFREASEGAIEAWFANLLDRSPLPVIVYNFPKRAGMALSAEFIGRLGPHPMMAGVKDSSGERTNLAGYRGALSRPDQVLFVGDETLLWEALESGWSGTISGASNVLAMPIAAVVADYLSTAQDGGRAPVPAGAKGLHESAEAKFRIVLPVIEAIRKRPQPASHKALLHAWGVLPTPNVRLPLTTLTLADVDDLRELILRQTGIGA